MRVWVPGGTGAIGSSIVSALDRSLGEDNVRSTGEDIDVRYFPELRRYVLRRGPFDALVYAVGVNYLDWSERMDPKHMRNLYDTNVCGLLRCIQAAPMVQRVVVIGSDAAWRPMRTSVAYCASKAALHMAVAVIARERPDLQINVVAPGKVAGGDMTEYVDRRSAELRPEIDHIAYQRSQIPGGEFVPVEDIADTVCWLLFDAPASIHGQVIPVNGGRS